jgi:hypothetical protein
MISSMSVGRNARVFPELEVDRLCHQPAGHGGP